MSMTKRALLWLMALFYVAGGVNHFADPDFYMPLMPPYLPWHLELIYLSGVAEILLGVAVLVPSLRAMAAWGLIALLVAVFPANLHMALNNVVLPGLEDVPAVFRWVRLPLQGLFIAWAWWYTD